MFRKYFIIAFILIPSLAQAGGATPGADARQQQEVRGQESLKIDRQKTIESNRARRESESRSRSAERSRSRSHRYSVDSDSSQSASSEISINAIPLIAAELANASDHFDGPCASIFSSGQPYTPVVDPGLGKFYVDPYGGVNGGFTYSSGDTGRIPAMVRANTPNAKTAAIVLSCYKWAGRLEQMAAQDLGRKGASYAGMFRDHGFSLSAMGGAKNTVVINDDFELPIEVAKRAVRLAVLSAVVDYMNAHPDLKLTHTMPLWEEDGGLVGKTCVFPTLRGFETGQRVVQCGQLVIDTASKTATMDGEPWYSAKGAYGVTAVFRFVSGHTWKRAVAESRDYSNRNSEQSNSSSSTERGFSASARKTFGTDTQESGSASSSAGTSAGLNGGQ